MHGKILILVFKGVCDDQNQQKRQTTEASTLVWLLGATALNQFLLMPAFQLHFPISEFFKQLARETF